MRRPVRPTYLPTVGAPKKTMSYINTWPRPQHAARCVPPSATAPRLRAARGPTTPSRAHVQQRPSPPSPSVPTRSQGLLSLSPVRRPVPPLPRRPSRLRTAFILHLSWCTKTPHTCSQHTCSQHTCPRPELTPRPSLWRTSMAHISCPSVWVAQTAGVCVCVCVFVCECV